MRYMIVIMIEFAVAIIMRIIIQKNSESIERRWFEYIIFVVFTAMAVTTAFFVTDTFEGVIAVSLLHIIYGITLWLNHTPQRTPLNNIMKIVLIPCLFLFMYGSAYYILTSAFALFFPMMLLSLIIFGHVHSVKFKNFNEWVPVVIGIGVVLIIAFGVNVKKIEPGSIKEVVAKSFVENELDMEVKHMTVDTGIRGEGIEINVVTAIDSKVIKMTYKNNEISDYDIEE